MDTPCDLWTGPRTAGGYGRLTIGGSLHYAHRIVWQQDHGPIPDGLLVCHSCDTPACIAIDHLWLGTPADNQRDMAAKGRARNMNKGKPVCKNGHADWSVQRNGSRVCLTCHREWKRQWRSARAT